MPPARHIREVGAGLRVDDKILHGTIPYVPFCGILRRDGIAEFFLRRWRLGAHDQIGSIDSRDRFCDLGPLGRLVAAKSLRPEPALTGLPLDKP
jgi:hypothetical protein